MDTLADNRALLNLDDRLVPRRSAGVNIVLTNDYNATEKLLASIDKLKISKVGLGYSGEFTEVSDWHLFVERLISKGVVVSALSNFSKLFSPDEVETLSKMQVIQISVDSSDARLQRQFRQGMELRTVVYNIGAIVANAVNAGRAVPRLEWVCTLNDKLVEKFESYVAFAVALGIDQIIVNQPLPLREIHAEYKDILQLSGEELRRAYECILAGIELGKRHNLEVLCQWLPLLEKRLAE